MRKQFTAYERDIEIGLDFAQARYYNNQHGRFTTVDPLAASAKLANPQTWNRFLYVINNPLKFTDPDGLCPAPTVGPGQVGICVEAFIAAKKIDGIGNGDNRTHDPNSNASARMRVVSVFTATETTIDESRRETLISGSSVSVPMANTVAGGTVEVGPPAVPAGGEIGVASSSTAPQGTEGFGNGLTTSTTVNVELRNGANGFQVLGENLQTTGAVQAASGNPVAGAITNTAGRVVSAAAPAGTIDVSARIRISGSGDNIRVSGVGQSRPYPSVTGWAYIGMSDGSVRTVRLFRQNETKPSDLTKPMRPIQ